MASSVLSWFWLFKRQQFHRGHSIRRCLAVFSQLNVFFWTNSRQMSVLRVIDSAMTGIKLALDEAGIDVPYPHKVVLTQPPTTPRDGTSPENY